MVSFSCEVCNDTLVKRKLMPHFNRCPNAYFTCIDCNTTFQGNDFQSHTSCISEDQKYQGKLYKEKAQKQAKQPAQKPVQKVEEPKKEKTESKTKSKKSKAKDTEKEPKIETIPIESTQSLHKVLKSLKKTHKLDTKELLKKLQITPEGKLELA